MSKLSFFPIELSYIIPCYIEEHNKDSIDKLLRIYASYDKALVDRIQFVLVDDHSPLPVSIDSDLDLNVKVLRINENIPWNQPGAHNLAVLYASCDKMIMSDLDHLFPEKSLRHIVDLPQLGKLMYKPFRYAADGSELHPHPNTFILSRGRFFENYGYDEEFSGAYGYEDGFFWRWQRYNGTRFRYMSKCYPIHVRPGKDNGATEGLSRDKVHNKKIRTRKLQEIAEFGPAGGHSRQFLNFTWTMVEDRKRKRLTWQAPKRPIWKKVWWWRTFFGV